MLVSIKTIGAYQFHAQFEGMSVASDRRYQVIDDCSRSLVARLSSLGAMVQCNIMRLELTRCLEGQGRLGEAISILGKLVTVPISEITISTNR